MTTNQALELALHHALQGRPNESEALLRTCPQDDQRVRFNLGWHDLRHDKFAQGFEGLDIGRWLNVWGDDPIGGAIYRDEDIEGKTVLLRLEGGLGDQIIGFRFAHTLKDMGAMVVISCDKILGQFFKNQGFTCVQSEAARYMIYDYWVPGMSVVNLLGFEHETIPNVPYIIPSTCKSLPPSKGNLKVGLCWAGNPEFEHEQYRQFPKELMLDLVPIEGATFYSFQRDNELVENLPFIDLVNDMETIEDTASQLAELDILITSDTMVTHLAASMGVEVWNIIPIMPYYLYAMVGNTTPWYDNMKLYRQTVFGEWDDVFQKIKVDLHKKVKEN